MDVRERVANKRLIDSNALNERFDKRIKWLRLDMHDQYSLGLYHGAVTDKDLIGEMPTVDAVEVVRCLECKHKGWVQEPCHGKSVDYCRMWECCLGNLNTTFCSYGERKEGADND